jgi:hypothetical protein
MERGRKRALRSASGGLGRSLPSTPGANALRAISSPAWAHIQALIDSGGQIMIGSIAPIQGAAVAHDGSKTLVMLLRCPGEAIQELLARLDVAIGTAKSTGTRVDEINVKSSDTRYEI